VVKRETDILIPSNGGKDPTRYMGFGTRNVIPITSSDEP